MAIKQRKDSIHATVSPYIKRKAETLVDSGEFSSMSDLVGVALAEFIGKHDRERKENEISKLRDLRDLVIDDHMIAKAKELESGQPTDNPGRIKYPPRKEREEECLEEMCPEPRELTPEEARKAAEAKEYYKKLCGEEKEEPFTRKVIID